ncbi:GtrA family protein [Virgisporangium aurantiacum]|nr:hypothetical protein [Virgisporangium aurantiacum]
MLDSHAPSKPSQARPAGGSAFASFARFVLFGGGVGLASSAAVPLVATLMPWVVANALITVASTLLGTELHARFVFGAGRRAHWRQHVQSAGSATVAYLVTSAAIAVLHLVQPAAGMRWEQAVYLSASGLAGTGRFLVLRLYVFARGRTSSAADPDGVRPVQTCAVPGGRRPGRRPSARPVVLRPRPYPRRRPRSRAARARPDASKPIRQATRDRGG